MSARLRGKGLSSFWAPASQDSAHVGNAGVGVVSLRGAPVALPTFAVAQLKRFFDCGRALRCMLPLGLGRFMHLVVLNGYQGADTDAEQLALTEQLFDAAFGELSVVAGRQPCLLVGDFNVEPTKIRCLAKGISAGLWVDLEEAWALAAGLRPAPTCKRDSSAAGGHRRVFYGRLPSGSSSCCPDSFLIAVGGHPGLLSLSRVLPFCLPLGCLLLIKVGVPSRLRFKGFGRFMMSVSSLCYVSSGCFAAG